MTGLAPWNLPVVNKTLKMRARPGSSCRTRNNASYYLWFGVRRGLISSCTSPSNLMRGSPSAANWNKRRPFNTRPSQHNKIHRHVYKMYLHVFFYFLAECVIALQSSAIILRRRLSVSNASVLWQNNCKYDHAVYTGKQLRISAVRMVSLKTKFEGCPLHQGLNLCWGGLRLCRTVIARYILKYDATLLPGSQSQSSL